MYSLGSYFAGGLAVLLAFYNLAPPVGTGLTLADRAGAPAVVTAPGAVAPLYVVNRARKGDRLILSMVATRTLPSTAAPVDQRKVLVGCDPAFSPLIVSGRRNFPSRCLADSGMAQKIVTALR